MARYRITESRLRNMIREAVKDALNEVKVEGDPYERLSDFENSLRTFDGGINCEEDLAEFMVDNNISIDDLRQYSGIVNRIDMRKLIKEIEVFKRANDDWEKREKYDEYRAWAEDRMSDMGFGFEGD